MANAVKHRDYLVELDWRVYDPDTGSVTSTTYRWSRFGTRSHGGNTYIARILSLGDITTPYIDRKDAHFDEVSLEIGNTAEDLSNDLPFHVLRAENNFRMKRLRVYTYDVLTDTKRLIWWGYTKAISYNPSEFSATITASFSWDSIKINIPKIMMGHRCAAGFPEDMTEMEPGDTNGCTWNGTTVGVAPTTGSATSCDKTWDGSNGCLDKGNLQQFLGVIKIAPVLNDVKSNWVDKDKVRDAPFPIVYGVGDLKVKPEVYHARVKDGILMCNFFVSGCHAGQPFLDTDIGSIRIGGAQKARFFKMYYGDAVQAIPANRTKFADGLGHSHVCHGYAEFELTKPQIDKFAQDVPFHLLTIRLKNGRKTKSGSRTDNHVNVIVDMLQDPIFGMGIPDSDIDSAAVAAAAAANAFTGRFELDKQLKNQEWIQNMCGSFHGYITFNDGKMQVGKKTNAETEVATFGTGGLRIIDWLEVNLEEDDVSDLVNTLNVRYRGKFREPKKFQFYDMQARRAAGNGIDTPVEKDVFLDGIYDDYQAQVSAATLLREELNLTFRITFTTSIDDWETGGAKTGQIIRVNSHHIPNNDSNYWFRVTGVTYSEDEETVAVRGRVYKQAVYDFDTDTLGDVLTGPGDTSVTQTPPDVQDFTAVGRRVKDDDDDGYNEEIYCTWTYPGMDAGDQAELDEESVPYTEDTIEEVLLMWRYTDDQEFRLTTGITVRYPQAEGTFQVPFHKNRTVEVWAVSRGRNHGTGEVGYVKNSDKTDYLDGDVTATQVTWDVGDTTLFAVDDYVKCGSEYCKIASKTATTLTLYNTAGVRDAQFNSDNVEHDDGTEVAVVEPSSPIAYVDMSVIRATLPVVTGVVTRSRPRGVRVKWDDVVMDHIQNHFVYYSVNGSLDDLDTWVADWLPADPKTPPAGINLIRTKATHVLIPQEDIDTLYGSDASGVEVQVRISAKIKNNYSSALSALPGANGGHHNRPWAAPAAPEVDTDLTQLINLTSDRVQITVRVYATDDRVSVGARTFAQVNTHVIGLVLEKYSKALADWSGNFDPRTWDVEDPDATYQDVVFTLHKGSKWRIRRAFARNPGTKRVASALDLDEIFQVGSQSDVISALDPPNLAIAPFVDPGDENTDSIELDGNDSQLLVTWTQPGTPVALRELQVRKKKTAATKWRRVPAVQLLDRVDDNGNPFNDSVVPGKVVRVDVHHPRGVNMDFEVRLVGADGDTTAWATVNRDTTDDAGGEDLPLRDDTHGPSYPNTSHLSRNHVIGDAGSAKVDAVYTPYMDGLTADNAWDVPDATYGPVRTVSVVLQRRNAAGTADVGNPLRFRGEVQNGTGTLASPFHVPLTGLDLGVIYRIAKLVYRNNSDEVERITGAPGTFDSTIDFVAGASSYGYDASVITSGVMTRTADNNRQSILNVNYTQPATPALLKEAVFEAQYAGGGWLHIGTKNILSKAGRFSITGPITGLKQSVQHRKRRVNDLDFRVIIVPFGVHYETGDTVPATCETITLSSQSSAEDDEFNSVAPPGGSITTPTIKWTRKGLRLRVGPLNAATDGFMGITKYGWVLRANDDSTYVTIEGASSATRAGAEFFTTNSHTTLVLRRRDLASALRTTGLKVYVRVFAMVAGVETSSISGVTLGAGGDAQAGYSAASTGTGALETDAFNDDDGISIRRNYHGTAPLIEGGACLNGRGPTQFNNTGLASPDLIMGRNWRVGSAANGLSTANAENVANVSQTVSGTDNFLRTTAKYGVSWDRANHRVQMVTSGARLATTFGRSLHAGRFISVSWLMGAATAKTLDSLYLHLILFKNSTNTAGSDGVVEVWDIAPPIGSGDFGINGGAIALPAVSASVGYIPVGVTFQVPSNFAASAQDRNAALVWTPSWTGSATIYMDDMQAYYGRSIRGFNPGRIEADLDSVVVTSASTPHVATGVDTGILNDGIAIATMSTFAID